MLIKIVGIQPQSYTLDNGYSFTGEKIHAIDLDTKSEGQLGDQVMTFKLESTSPLTSIPLSIGEQYNIYFNQKGKPDFISPFKA